jgi:hypothetical protein
VWGGVVAGAAAWSQAEEAVEVTGITDDELQAHIVALGLKPTQVEQRFDFAFKAALNDEQWELSMSAVLSQDGESVWVMAWLDELPKSAAEVPRTALLRLLASNDKMGNGKFFAYIATNRRFVLQRVIETKGMNPEILKTALQDLGATVVETYPEWNVANWKEDGAATQASAPAAAPSTQQPPVRSAANESKFQQPVRK